MNKTKNILSILFIFIATLYLSVSISSIQVSDKQDNKAKSGQTINLWLISRSLYLPNGQRQTSFPQKLNH